jgi:DNA-binding transcriptional MocR family regulator
MLDRSASAGQLVDLLGAWHHGGPTYRALAERISMLVLDGRLPPDTRLPSERSLAGALGSSRTTVAAAYALLRDAGFLASRRGAASRTRIPPGARGTGTGPAGLGSGTITPADGEEQQYDLGAAALPAPAQMTNAVEAAMRALPAHLTGHGYTTLGVPSLRELLAQQYTSRGLPTDPDQILVMGGTLQALALVLRAFVSPGDRILVEHPTYPNALEAIRQLPARAVPVPLRPGGWDLPTLEATLRQSSPRLAYLVPDFHNPTGLLMSAPARERVAAAAARTRTLTVVDETVADLALDVSPEAMPPPLAAYDRRDLVVLLGSTSKSFWGGLGVGWVRTPASLVPTLLAVRAATDLGTSILSQLTAAELLVRRQPILAERRAMLRSRRTALVAALRAHLPDWRFAEPPGGLGLWCELSDPVSSALAVMAGQYGIRLAGGPKFGTDGAFERFVRLPFTLPEVELADAVRRLAGLYDGVAGAYRRQPGLPGARTDQAGRPAGDLTPIVT